MTYRPHSQRCQHRVQGTQGSNQHQLRITCQECKGHLAIIYGKHLVTESRLLIQDHLYETAPGPPPMQRPQPSAHAAGTTSEPQGGKDPAVTPDDVAERRARLTSRITELSEEMRMLTAELEDLPQQVPPPPARGLPRQVPPRPARPPPESRQEAAPKALKVL